MPRRRRVGTGAPTIAEVAARAGVSTQTVSRAIRSRSRISVETRERVLNLVREMGYLPNRNAQSLASTKSNLVGLITHALANIGPTQTLVQLEEAAKARGFNVIVTDIDENPHSIRAAFDQLCAYRVLGIQVNFPLRIDFGVFRDLGRRVPVVLHDVRVGPEVASVVFRHAKGAQLLTEHLLGLGHRRLAYLGGPKTWIAEHERRQSWLRVLRRARLKPGPVFHGDWGAATAYAQAKELLRRHRGAFSAVVAGSDLMAVGLLRALNEAGIAVPAEVSVGSFGDFPFAGLLTPSLTTVRQDFAQVGRLGFACLLSALENPGSPLQQLDLEPALQIRESTAPAADRGSEG
ncbi:MAG TPA: LacI family DNA-binding transcriptional regulator [Chthoniobacterales bacterium]